MPTKTNGQRKPSWYLNQLRKVDDEFCQQVHEQILEGGTLKSAARVMGIPPGKMVAWLREGAEQLQQAYDEDRPGPAIEPEAALYLAVEKAYGLRDQEFYRRVAEARKDDEQEWQPAMKLLERLDRENFGTDTQRVELEVSGPEGGPIALEGRAIVGLADVNRLALSLGYGHLVGLDGGDPQRSISAPEDVLPDPVPGGTEPVGD